MSEVTEFDSDDEIADLQCQLNAATVAPTMRKLFVVISTKKENKSKKMLEEKNKKLEEKDKMLEEKTKEHKDLKEGTGIRFIMSFYSNFSEFVLLIAFCPISDFYNLKLPGLRPGFCNNNNTAADGGDHTEAITRELKDFGFEEPRTPPLGHPLFDRRREKDDKLQFSTQSDVRGFVKDYLLVARHAAGLVGDLVANNEVYIASCRPDILILKEQDGSPLGVVEVRKPTFDSRGRPQLTPSCRPTFKARCSTISPS